MIIFGDGCGNKCVIIHVELKFSNNKFTYGNNLKVFATKGFSVDYDVTDNLITDTESKRIVVERKYLNPSVGSNPKKNLELTKQVLKLTTDYLMEELNYPKRFKVPTGTVALAKGDLTSVTENVVVSTLVGMIENLVKKHVFE